MVLILVIGGAFGIGSSLGWFRDEAVAVPVEVRLIAESEQWDLLAIKEGAQEKLHLRSRGVEVKTGEMTPDEFVERNSTSGYRAQVVSPPGAARPTIFGVLPEGAVRAEALSLHTDESVTVRVRTSKALAFPFVVEAAPGSAEAWQAGDRVTIRVYDRQNRQILPG